MSILIKGMEMPSSCQPCKLKRFAGSRVLSGCKPEVLYECPFCDELFSLKNTRQPSCKFEQLPIPHGRLIDADRLIKALEKQWNVDDDQDFANKTVWREIESAPTVIEKEDKQ